MKATYTIILILGYNLQIFACVCGRTYEVRQAYKRSDVVLEIRVLEWLDLNGRNDTVITNSGDTLVKSPVFGYSKKVEVLASYKGNHIKKEMIIQGKDDNCEKYLEVGQTYLIYGRMDGDEILTNRCTRSGILDGHVDIPYLEKKKKKTVPNNG